MAALTAVNTKHATLTGTTADTVTFSGQGQSLAVTNRDATNTAYFTKNGGTAVAAAAETFVVLPLNTKVLEVHGNPGPISVVGNGGGYSVELF